MQTSLTDLVIEGEFAEDGSSITLSRFEGVLDTRGLSTAIDPNGGPSVACDLLSDVAGVDCIECGPPTPGAFCTVIETEPMVMPRQDGVDFEVVACEDLIARFAASGECADEAAEFDPNGNGMYDLCPAWGG